MPFISAHTASNPQPVTRKVHPMTVDAAAAMARTILPTCPPYTPAAVLEAARVAAELVRNLNHATPDHTAADVLAAPQDVDCLLQALADLLERIPQLCRQIGDRVEALGADPRLRTDFLGTNQDPKVVAMSVLMCLDDAGTAVSQAAVQTRSAAHKMSRLALRDMPLAAVDLTAP